MASSKNSVTLPVHLMAECFRLDVHVACALIERRTSVKSKMDLSLMGGAKSTTKGGARTTKKGEEHKDEFLNAFHEEELLDTPPTVDLGDWRRALSYAQRIVFLMVPGLIIAIPLVVLFIISLVLKSWVAGAIPVVGIMAYVGYLYFLYTLTKHKYLTNISFCMPMEHTADTDTVVVDADNGGPSEMFPYPFSVFSNRLYNILYHGPTLDL